MLSFKCQEKTIESLKSYASDKKHSILISGCEGCGKTTLAKLYASFIDVSDVAVIQPKVSDIKNAFEDIASLRNDIVLVIENLDYGVPACSYALLKSMEEPLENVYIVVTCTDIQKVPDTIKSRSMVIDVMPPVECDLSLYALDKYQLKLSKIKIRECLKSFSDVDYIHSIDDEKISYISKWANLKIFDQPVSSASWKLGHFDDGSEAPSKMIVRFIMSRNMDDKHILESCIRCLDNLNSNRIAPYLSLSRLAFDLKYCE